MQNVIWIHKKQTLPTGFCLFFSFYGINLLVTYTVINATEGERI